MSIYRSSRTQRPRRDARIAATTALTALNAAMGASIGGACPSSAWAQAAPAANGAVAPDAAAPTVSEVLVLAPAMRISPSNVPLNVTEPTSTVPGGFIRNNIISLASYDDIIKFQPSIWSQNPNGPGIGKAETISLRGFQDGQYNVTFDGIPFGDSTDLHHTTSALFIAHDLAEAEIDRGPGTASTIGKATFGGTVGFVTKPADPVAGVVGYGTVGSYDTGAYGVELDSGKTPLGSSGLEQRAFVDYQHESTDGYLTGSKERRSNVLFKDEIQLGEKTTLTVLGTYNHEFQYTTQGATLAQYAKYGDNYGLCNDRKLQCFYAYQPSNYYSDFEYIKLKTEIGGLNIENTVYTDAFGHSYTESKDASDDNAADNGVTFYNAAGKKVATYANDISGKLTRAAFRAWGDTLRLSYDTPYGELKGGFWFDQNHDGRYSLATDLTQGNIPVPGKNGSAYSYDYKNVGTTYQPYIEFDWKPLPNLVLTPGLKYTDFDRSVNALINKTTKLPLHYGESFDALQPEIAANYTIIKGWTAYAQVAKGFLAPPIDVFQVTTIAGLKPEETLNYQIGTAARHDRWMVGADAYYIDFSNFLTPTQVPGTTDSTYVNGGGAIYEGVEFEGQYALDHGFSLYGNYSYNSAKYKHTSVQIAEAPEWTLAAGLLYDNPVGPYFSVIGKVIGPRYGQDNTTNAAGATVFADDYRIGVTGAVDLAAGWKFGAVGPYMKNLTASVKVGNLFDSRAVDDFAGTQSVSGAPLYWRNPGRSLFFNLEAKVF